MKTQTFDLKKTEVTELSKNESEQTNGGIGPFAIALIAAGIGAGATLINGRWNRPKASSSGGCNVTVNNYGR